MEEDIKEAYIESYKEIKRNKDVVKSIDKDYFFEFADYLINRNKDLEEENIQYRAKYLIELNRQEYNIPKSKVKEKQIKENEIRRNRFLYGNYECPSESYKYKYTDIDMNDYAGMEVNRVLQELLED